jgi:hypothetical protein
MSEVSTFRLYLLRAMYVFTVVGLAIEKLPALLHPATLSPQDSVILSVLGATALLAVLGIRYPIKMLPLLFFEFVWKSIWILIFGLPLLLSGHLDPNVSFGGTETLIACLVGVVLVPIAMPWGYVFKHYLKVPGARWGKQQVSAVASEPTNPNDGGVSTGVEQPAAVVPTNGSARSEPRMKLQRERPGRGPHGF